VTITDAATVPVKVLIDRSVRYDAITGEHGFQVAEGELFGRKYQYLQPATRTRPPRIDWKQAEIESLPEVAKLIREGRIEAFTTDELYAEASPVDKLSPPEETDIFEGCIFNDLPAPLERSKWGLDLDHFCSREEVIAYCECFFLTSSAQRTERFIAGMSENPRFRLSPFEEKCLRRSHVFRAICKGIDRSHYPDALHLWTAEENGMDAFLTHDRKFRNVIARQNVALHCKVIFPSHLLKEVLVPEGMNRE
jgi:hypothetical protein